MGSTHVNMIQPGSPGPSADIQTKPPFVAFQAGNVPPSQAIYLQLNDVVFVRVFSNTAFTGFQFSYRYLTPQGEIKEGVLPVIPNGVPATVNFPIAEGWLLSIVMFPTIGLTAGTWVFAQIGIARGILTGGAFPFQGIIWQGYVLNGGVNGWPGTPAKEVWDGPGTPRVITGTTPAAGADINEVVPSNRRWQLLGLDALLQTGAAVANRNVQFALDDGANVWHLAGTAASQVAATSQRYMFVPGLNQFADISLNTIVPAPPITTLKAGFRIRTITQNIQAADQWSLLRYEILEWGSIDA